MGSFIKWRSLHLQRFFRFKNYLVSIPNFLFNWPQFQSLQNDTLKISKFCTKRLQLDNKIERRSLQKWKFSYFSQLSSNNNETSKMAILHDHIDFGPQIPFWALKAYFRLLTPQNMCFWLHVKFWIEGCITQPYWFWAPNEVFGSELLKAYFHLWTPEILFFSSCKIPNRCIYHTTILFWAPNSVFGLCSDRVFSLFWPIVEHIFFVKFLIYWCVIWPMSFLSPLVPSRGNRRIPKIFMLRTLSTKLQFCVFKFLL
jgi:hypothetical protein